MTPPELSPRAARFLATLPRRPWLATERVEALLIADGCPAFPAWLHFHERYAGYEETFYLDGFVWGLAHREPYWWNPERVNWERDGPGYDVWCADGHPTYSYQLDQDGVFAAHGQHRTFDLYVERMAAFREFVKGSREVPREVLLGAEFRAEFDTRVRPFLVPDLTDQFRRYYLSGTHLVIESAEDDRLSRAWVRIG